MIGLFTSGAETLVAVDAINDTAATPTSIITYGRFLEYIENGWVKRVDFYKDRKSVV